MGNGFAWNKSADMSDQLPIRLMSTPQLVRRAAQLGAMATMAGTVGARNEFNRLARRYTALVTERETAATAGGDAEPLMTLRTPSSE